MASKNTTTRTSSKIESEKYLDKLLVKTVKDNEGLCIKLVTTHFTGLPDRLCLLPGGRIFFAEIKTTNKKPRKIQSVVHSKLRGLGFDVFVIDNSDFIKSLFKMD